MEIKIIKIDEEKALKNINMGIRFDRCKTLRRMGAEVPASWDWPYEEETGKKRRLDGTCALTFGGGFSFDDLEELKKEAEKVLEEVGKYPYNCIYIIAGTDSDYGDDTGEVIIRNAEVIGILEIED